MAKVQSRAAKVKSVRHESRQQREPESQEEISDFEARNDRQVKHSARSARPVKSENGFVSLTKLFESRKNPDNLVGTCKVENLSKLSDLIIEAEEQNTGLAFFVFLQGKWGPSLCAAVAQERQDSNFNGGSRRSRGRSY